MEIQPETRNRIRETVMEILRVADMDQTTECQVRTAAAQRLGIDLSGSEYWRHVREVVESFLLSTCETVNEPPGTCPNVPEETKKVVRDEQEQESVPSNVEGDKDLFVCQLSENRQVVVQNSKEGKSVSIRECYLNGGKLTPKLKNNEGVTSTTEQWSAFRESFPAIQEAISNMDQKIQSEHVGNQNDEVPCSVTNSTRRFVPIKTIRLDEKNYYCWAQCMEKFLDQLKIAYVLSDPCPNIAPSSGLSVEDHCPNIGPAQTSLMFSRTPAHSNAVQKWEEDDYICHHNILQSLPDHLFNIYSRRTMSARQLWEELKLFCLSEHGTKRSLVKKYFEFKMVDRISVLEQVHELNKIADSVAAAGMFINEDFHVSTIISKLPPSWKGSRMQLMCEEHLPFKMLMDSLKAEEESRSAEKRWESLSCSPRVGGSNFVMNRGRNGTEEEIRVGPSNSVLGGHRANKTDCSNGNSVSKFRFTPNGTHRGKWGRRPRQEPRRY